MYLFFIKKNFFDGWDNMLLLFIVNLVMLAAVAVLLTLIYAVRNVMPLVIALIVASGMIMSLFVFAFGYSAANIANFESAHIADYFKAIPRCIKDALFFGMLLGAIAAASYVCIPFYFAQQSMIGVFLGAMFTWLVVFTLLALQWFVALRSLLHDNFKKCLKKCFLIFFDNVGFSVFMVFYTAVLVAISVFTMGTIPSASGITLARVNALRLRLYKYDYLDAHRELTAAKERRRIPWDELLRDDKELAGSRSFKSFIFPWKD
ncbi:MAG: hypothetical protein IJR50_09505 [Treponema sp.]|nr:hypothetical protein [Treponema sp.]